MASSYVAYRGSGLWIRDGILEVWLQLLVNAVDRLDSIPDWMKELRDHWRTQATSGFTGFIDVALDTFIVDDQRREMLMGLSEKAVNDLDKFGEEIPSEFLNGFELGGKGTRFLQPIATEVFKNIGQKFVRLLRGKLSQEESAVEVL